MGDVLVFGSSGVEIELRLGLAEEERLLDVLLERRRSRLEAPQPEVGGNLLQARADAIAAGLVPLQRSRPRKLTSAEQVEHMRRLNRAS